MGSPTARREIFAAARQIPIEQRGHDRQRIGVGVEAMRLLIGRKDKRAVHLHSEQIAHCVGIFGAIEAMQICRAARVRIRSSRAIELSLEPADDRVVGLVVGAPARGGGIARDRSFRTTFSHVSGELAMRSASCGSSTKLPAFNFGLWQDTQYVAHEIPCW